jgi:zinc transporter 2
VAISIDKNEGTKATKNLSSTHDHENLNVRASIIHILGDILQSIGVIIASILIWISPEKLKLADPIVTFIFAIIVFYTTLQVVKDCIFVLMEGTPAEMDIEEFEQMLHNIEGVVEVHDLHVWSLGVGKPSMSAHIYATNDTVAVLKRATKVCRSFGIYHSTIQVETTQDKKHEDYIECAHNIH